MPTVKEVPRPEQEIRKERYVMATAYGRKLEILRAYELREALDAACSEDERDDIILDWAPDAGRDVDALRRENEWTALIRLADLRQAFAQEGIKEDEWLERLTVDHLRVIGMARVGARHLSSKDKAKLAVDAYHANYSVDELREHLAGQGLVPARKGMPSLPVQGLMISDVLIDFANWMKRTGQDGPATQLHFEVMRKLLNPQDVLLLVKNWMQGMYGRVVIPPDLVQKWSQKERGGNRE